MMKLETQFFLENVEVSKEVSGPDLQLTGHQNKYFLMPIDNLF